MECTIKPTADWSLLAAKQNERIFLLPVKKRNAVLYLTDATWFSVPPFVSSLRRACVLEDAYVYDPQHTYMSYPKNESNYQLYSKETAKTLYGSVAVVGNVIDSLWYSLQNKDILSLSDTNIISLSSTDADTLLNHLSLMTFQIEN